ncbi:MAG TPA: TolC family protein [Vicinamibacterales bacterium]|nr:TolC family protein [Vicinamibacterales bacterium]
MRSGLCAGRAARHGGLAAALGSLALAASSYGQTAPVPVVRVTFPEAIQRAQDHNPTLAAAATGILRAEALLRQARAAALLQVSGNVTTTTLNTGVDFSGVTVTPRNQVTGTVTADMPILAAAAWAHRAQAQDAKDVADLSVAETRRQIAFATADAYLAIIAQRRVVEGNVRSRDVAKAHFDLAAELERRGTGSRLNALRAQQQVSSDEGLVEGARLALYRSQEALGVLIAADGPADAAEEPDFTVAAVQGDLRMWRSDLKLFAAQQQAAERVVRDSSWDWYPTVDAIFQPSSTFPAQFFLPQNSWRFLIQANIPIFDSGQRGSVKAQRQADLERTRAVLAGAMTEANSEVRAAREAVASGERLLVSARAAADQAQQVVVITNVSFRAGAATNIEVIDAGRVARDTDTAVAVAEDQLRRARLELLNALGRFP